MVKGWRHGFCWAIKSLFLSNPDLIQWTLSLYLSLPLMNFIIFIFNNNDTPPHTHTHPLHESSPIRLRFGVNWSRDNYVRPWPHTCCPYLSLILFLLCILTWLALQCCPLANSSCSSSCFYCLSTVPHVRWGCMTQLTQLVTLNAFLL